ncbi:MAG: hypothetical protein ACI4SX_06505, partial [Candidatus Fimenecus sp.]
GTQKKSSNWKIIPTVITIIGFVYIVVLLFGGSNGDLSFGGSNSEESKAIEAAEKHVKQSVYVDVGVVPESFKSKVIYKDGDKRLIWVRVALEEGSSDWGAGYCVYTIHDIVRNCTESMGGGYDFEDHLEEIKALFAL